MTFWWQGLWFQGALSLLYLCISDSVYDLINYASFVESSFILLSIASLLWLRYKRPDMERPIRVSLGIPIAFLLICSFLVFMPFYVEPLVVGMAVLITAIGVPVYLVGVWWRRKPEWLIRVMGKNFINFLNLPILALQMKLDVPNSFQVSSTSIHRRFF